MAVIGAYRGHMKGRQKPDRKRKEGIIALEDLAPRKDPRGGGGSSGKTVFGEGPVMTGANEGKAAKKKIRTER